MYNFINSQIYKDAENPTKLKIILQMFGQEP